MINLYLCYEQHQKLHNLTFLELLSSGETSVYTVLKSEDKIRNYMCNDTEL